MNERKPGWKRVPIRDVPAARRMKAAQAVCASENDLRVRVRVLELAIDPGDLVAWVRR